MAVEMDLGKVKFRCLMMYCVEEEKRGGRMHLLGGMQVRIDGSIVLYYKKYYIELNSIKVL